MGDPKPNRNAPAVAAWLSEALQLSPNIEREIRSIRDDDAFVAAIADIAGGYRAEVAFEDVEHGKVTPGQYRAALRHLIRTTDRRAALAELDWLTIGRIEAQAFTTFGVDNATRLDDEMLLSVATRLLEADPGKNRDKSTSAAVFAAWQLRQVFARCGLQFTAYDGGSDGMQAGPDRPGGPAARCLRIIMGRLIEYDVDGRITGNVEHILKAALAMPPLS